MANVFLDAGRRFGVRLFQRNNVENASEVAKQIIERMEGFNKIEVQATLKKMREIRHPAHNEVRKLIGSYLYS